MDIENREPNRLEEFRGDIKMRMLLISYFVAEALRQPETGLLPCLEEIRRNVSHAWDAIKKTL